VNSFPDTLCTPTIDGNNIYVSSGYCDIACINKETGIITWQVDGYEKYEGKTGEWGYSESLLIIGEMVFFTPAGDKTTMVAVNKHTGEEIWVSKSLNDFTGYCSPIAVKENGIDIIITVLAKNILGINANTGDVLFQTNYAAVGSEEAVKMWDGAPFVNANSPLYKNKEIYVTSGYNHVGAKYRLSDDLKELTLVWVDTILDVHHGGVVLVDGHIYGANWLNNAKGNWCCINWETGKALYETEWQTKGSIISAEGLLYCYDEKRGNIALVEPNPESFKIVSEYTVPKGKGPHWSHLVINKGKMYVRHENALMVYDISNK
jgi:outer membrane protein assembly factor BamB